MHKEAEFGIAAHWYYSEQKGLKKYLKRISPKVPEKELKWVRQLREWQENFKETCPDEFIESLKIEFFKDRIFVFTPKGDVIDLPEGSTPVDFAYRIHTDIGNHCTGAKVNGKIVPLSYKLQNADIVEILVDKKRSPNRDWLNFVKTSIARSHIRKYLKRKNGRGSPKIEILKEIPKKIPSIKKILPLVETKKPAEIKVAGQKGVMINLAKCCNPKRGDKIIGYITKTKGASIHRADCKNLKSLKARWPEKIIKAEWT
jgi:GTP pyrophosphokinase